MPQERSFHIGTARPLVIQVPGPGNEMSCGANEEETVENEKGKQLLRWMKLIMTGILQSTESLILLFIFTFPKCEVCL